MLKKNIIITILLLMPIITAVTMINPSISETTKKSVSMEEIAKYYAPIWYQDVNSADADADYITNFDFDQNWKGTDNWENQENTTYHPLKPYIYYSVVETTSHWYIGYYDFHPRDWSIIPFDPQHENDMEGCIAIILKDGSTYGQAQALITQAHGELHQYRYSTDAGNKLTNDQATIDETCHVTENGVNDGYRAHLFVNAQGHGVYAAPYLLLVLNWWDEEGFPGGDGVIYGYNPANTSTGPIDQPGNQTVDYALVDVSAIYDRVDNGEMYYHNDNYYYDDPFRGDTHDENKALPPWAWGEFDSSEKGWIFWEPWKTANVFFDGETFSDELIRTNYDDPFRGDTEGENKALPPWAWGADDGSEKGWIFWEPWKTANVFFDGETFSDELIRTNYDDRGTGEVSEFLWNPITIAVTVITITAILTIVLKKQKH